MDYAWYLFSFKGRISRARYLAVQLALLTVWLVLWLKFPFDFSSQWEAWVVAFAVIWINLATTARRLPSGLNAVGSSSSTKNHHTR